MIALETRECPPTLEPSLRHARQLFGKLHAAIFTSAPGWWGSFLPQGPSRRMFYFLFESGQHQFAPDEGDQVDERTSLDLRNTLVRICDAHQDPKRRYQADCAVILRRRAYIFLPESQDQPSLYVPLPDTSAHELLEDQQQLDAEFPGIFRMA